MNTGTRATLVWAVAVMANATAEPAEATIYTIANSVKLSRAQTNCPGTSRSLFFRPENPELGQLVCRDAPSTCDFDSHDVVVFSAKVLDAYATVGTYLRAVPATLEGAGYIHPGTSGRIAPDFILPNGAFQWDAPGRLPVGAESAILFVTYPLGSLAGATAWLSGSTLTCGPNTGLNCSANVGVLESPTTSEPPEACQSEDTNNGVVGLVPVAEAVPIIGRFGFASLGLLVLLGALALLRRPSRALT